MPLSGRNAIENRVAENLEFSMQSPNDVDFRTRSADVKEVRRVSRVSKKPNGDIDDSLIVTGCDVRNRKGCVEKEAVSEVRRRTGVSR